MPFAFELGQHVAAFGGAELAPFDFGHEQAFRVLGIRGDEVEFDVFFPIAGGSRKTGAAGVFKDGGGVIVDEFLLFFRRVGHPAALVG